MVVAIHTCGPYLSVNHYSGTFNWQIANMFDGGSRVAVDCFVLITGYFMCTKKSNTAAGVKKLLLPLLFYIFLYFPLFLRDYNFY
jgi:surface polysaccharide O-acyltransferase-like enzyme